MKEFLTSKKFTIIVGFVGLYLLSSGLSLAVFSYFGVFQKVNLSEKPADERARIASLPKTEECPINGKLFSKEERDIWETRRPITAMIENHADSRPLEGLQYADVVYEAVAEGGITRQMVVFYCGAAAGDVRIAPVRSARIYFINWAVEYGDYPIFAHVGGANNLCGDCPGGVKYRGQIAPEVRAIEQLVKLGWRTPRGNDFDTTYDSGFPVFFRDPERLGHAIATEHTMVSTTDSIFKEAQNRGFGYEYEGKAWTKSFTPWKFADESPLSSPVATDISFVFWDNKSDYDVEWKYDAANNRYLRFNGGREAVDLATGEQFGAGNVVIMFVDEKGPVDKEGHMFYDVIDKGKALIFQNGDAIEGTWEKSTQLSRTVVYDNNKKELKFVRDQIWIEAVPKGNEVKY